MESTLAWILASLVVAVLLALAILLQRRADERIAALMGDRSRILARERELASRFMAEQQAHEAARAQLVATEADRDVARGQVAAIEADRERLFAELDHRHRRIVDALTRIAAEVENRKSELERYAEAGAESILSRFPNLPEHPERGLGGTLGALITVQSYVNASLMRQFRHAEESVNTDDLEVNVIPFPSPGSGRRAAPESDAPSSGPASSEPSSPPVFTPPASTPANA